MSNLMVTIYSFDTIWFLANLDNGQVLTVKLDTFQG